MDRWYKGNGTECLDGIWIIQWWDWKKSNSKQSSFVNKNVQQMAGFSVPLSKCVKTSMVELKYFSGNLWNITKKSLYSHEETRQMFGYSKNIEKLKWKHFSLFYQPQDWAHAVMWPVVSKTTWSLSLSHTTYYADELSVAAFVFFYSIFSRQLLSM